uniref:prepilin-type N-terminal cleavage/methylation domain-containing protein n=1 Tax=Candidatus Scatousia sp. TaxID=3085663 RepID=UPI00402A5199
MKKGFTLAEVLITLGIIGIVAAMTLPGLNAKYKKNQTVTQLKKAYTVLAQAIKLSEVRNGSLDYWDYKLPAEDFYQNYLANYMSVNNKTITESG